MLLLSQLRASASTRASIRSIIRRPIFLVIIDIAVFAVASGISYAIGSFFSKSPNMNSFLLPLLGGAIITLPSFILGIVLLLGLVLEVSGGSQFTASDTINWLPITPSEYVIGSILTIFVYYSIAPVLMIALTLPLAFIYGMFSAWELATLLSIFGIIASASALEILRATLNRFSSSFYKKGGRGAIAARAVFGIMIIVVFQIFFNPNFYERIIGAITSNLGPSWFIPILWSSVSVAALLHGQSFVSASFALMFLVLTAVLFYGAIIARSKYWVPMPASVRVSNAVYSPKSRLPPLLGFLTSRQLAIARKDLRGLVRRREMVRFLAMPGVFIVLSLFSTASTGISGFQFFGFFMVSMTTLFIATASIGSEGKSISNLYQFPLSPKDFVIGKATPSIIFGCIFAVAFFVIMGMVSAFDVRLTAMLVVSAVLIVLEMTLMGITLGIRFPNFSESARASFMSQTTGLIGFPLSILLMLISLGPLLFTMIFSTDISFIASGFGASVLIDIVVSFVLYRTATGLARKLLSELPK